jgi:hypothetical protein
MTIEELRNRRDVWPIVLDAIPDAIEAVHMHIDMILNEPNLNEHLERKFRKGEAEHQRAWLHNTSDPSWLIPEAAEELLDFILYQAMFVVLTECVTKEQTNE